MKYLVVLLASLWVLIGCATGSGELFETVVRGEVGSSDSRTATASERDESVLEIESTPEDAKVYLNGELIGETPLAVGEIAAGDYHLTIEKRGYYEYEDWLEIENDRSYTVSVSLEQITGYLSLSSNTSDVEVTVDDITVDSGVSELPIGRYRLKGRAFGYQPIELEITIRENQTTDVLLDLIPAEFEIRTPALTRTRFAPDNPGMLGETVLRFEVTAPGSGHVMLSDTHGRTVRTEALGEFDSWEQRWEWDGTDDSGKPVDDGLYRIRVEVESVWNSIPATDVTVIDVVVDSSAVIRYYGALGSTVGTLFATAPRVLPAGSLQISASMTGHRSTTTSGIVGRYPVGITLRVGFPADLEAVIAGAAVLYSESSFVRTLVSMSVRRELSVSPVATAVGLRGTVFNRSTDGRWGTTDSFASYLGGGLFTPISVELGDIEIIATPELAFSPVPVTYAGAQDEIGFYAWSYFRAAVRYDAGAFLAAASAAIRTIPFSDGLGIDTPVSVGIESHLMIPNTPVYLSAVLTSEIDPSDGFYVSGGGGVGLIY